MINITSEDAMVIVCALEMRKNFIQTGSATRSLEQAEITGTRPLQLTASQLRCVASIDRLIEEYLRFV
jgi:hypothetical protein